MKWTLKDKLTLGGILPEQGSMFNMVLSRDIKKKLELLPKEVKDSKLTRSKDGDIAWEKDIEVKLDFTKDEYQLLTDSAHKIKQKDEITESNLDLIEKLTK